MSYQRQTLPINAAQISTLNGVLGCVELDNHPNCFHDASINQFAWLETQNTVIFYLNTNEK